MAFRVDISRLVSVINFGPVFWPILYFAMHLCFAYTELHLQIGFGDLKG